MFNPELTLKKGNYSKTKPNKKDQLDVKKAIKILNNLYFQKTVKHVFNNFSPKYVNIEHVVTQNESLNSILKKYEINYFLDWFFL